MPQDFHHGYWDQLNFLHRAQNDKDSGLFLLTMKALAYYNLSISNDMDIGNIDKLIYQQKFISIHYAPFIGFCRY